MTKMDERQKVEIRTLAARGIIADTVSRLAALLADRTITEAKEIRLQDLFLHHTLQYVQAIDGPGELEFMAPAPPTQPPRTAPTSTGPVHTVGPVDLDYQKRLEVEAKRVEDEVEEIAKSLPVSRPKAVAAS